MLQFLTYLLHKQIIEMRRSQNLRRPLSVLSRRLCVLGLIFNLPGRVVEPSSKQSIMLPMYARHFV